MFKLIQVSDIVESPASLRRGGISERMHKHLAASIKAMGLLSPLLVRPVPKTGWFKFLKRQKYQLLDGFQRLNACRSLGMKRVSCQIPDLRKYMRVST